MSLFKAKSPSAASVSSAAQPAAPGYERLVLAIPWTMVEAKLEAAAAVLSQAQPLAGFRAGHVPVDVARQKYGEPALLAEAYDLVVQNLYAQEVSKAKLPTVGQPQLEFNPSPAWGQDLTATATVPVLPKVTMPDWSKIKISPVKEEVKDEDVEKVMADLRDHYATEAAVDRAAQTGDLVALDYQVSLAGVPVEGGSGVGHKAVLGRQHLLPEIEQAVMGMKPGEQKNQSLTFAPSHPFKLLAGKTADCHLNLKQLWERRLPDLTDEWVATVGPFANVAEFKQRLKHDLEQEAEQRAVQQTEQKILESAIAAAAYGVFPDILITHETRQLMAELEHNLQHQGIKMDDYLLHLKKTPADLLLDLAKPALERLKVMLLLRAIINEHNLMPTDEELAGEVKRLAQFAKDPQLLQTAEARENILASLAQKKALAWLKGQIVAET